MNDRRTGLHALALLAALAAATTTARAEPVTIAFTGDQGTGPEARAVLELVRDRDADLLMIQGDFGYDRGAADDWIDDLELTLGPGFPVLGVVGNHENHEWPVYREWLEGRVAEVPELDCEGEVGVKARCSFRGISIAQVAPGIHEVPGVSPDDGYADYLVDALAGDPSPWRICSWHKNQRALQTGSKGDEAGWGVYEACLALGGIVATGHEHVYARTHLMSDFRAGTVAGRESPLVIEPGRSFAFVSGLGGKNPRTVSAVDDRWAATYSAEDGARAGALFCTFDGALADCRFEDVSGAVPDTFTLESRNVPGDGERARRVAHRWVGPGAMPVTSGGSGGGTAGPYALITGLALAAMSARRRKGWLGGRTPGRAREPDGGDSPGGHRASEGGRTQSERTRSP